jgi:predicted dehydrogenase
MGLDAVSIVVPTKLHYQIARNFLSNNIDVLVEKPITSNLKEADFLINLAKKKRRILQVGHIERFNSAFQATKKIIKNPKFIECHRLNPFPQRSLDIGVVLDLMIHDIDIILGLIDSHLERIEATGINVLTKREDIANARIIFQNGCICNLTASRISDETMRKIRIFQKNTYISLDYQLQEAFVYRKLKNEIVKEGIPIEKDQPLKKELASFIDCVQRRKKPLVSGLEAKEALKVALEIQDRIWQKNKS